MAANKINIVEKNTGAHVLNMSCLAVKKSHSGDDKLTIDLCQPVKLGEKTRW